MLTIEIVDDGLRPLFEFDAPWPDGEPFPDLIEFKGAYYARCRGVRPRDVRQMYFRVQPIAMTHLAGPVRMGT